MPASVAAAPAPGDLQTLETAYARIRIDKKGFISSLAAIATGREYSPASHPSALLSLHENGAPNDKLLQPVAASCSTTKVLGGVPALQQFAIPQAGGKPVASGCVPTSAASVVGFWIEHGDPQWRGDAGAELLRDLATRVRARLKMEAIADRDGYTDDGMTLAGAMPEDLAAALQADADEFHVPVRSRVGKFRYETLQAEIRAGRPVLLSCVVRLPQKPELSWGHEMVGVGWTKIGGVCFVGVVDNFYPVKDPGTIRWIREEAFETLISVEPVMGK